MNEIFVEQIIKSKTKATGIIFRAIGIVFVLIGILSIGKLTMLGITLTALFAYATYLIWVYTNVEYEYSILNSEFSVDEILGQRKRKHIADYDLKLAETIAPAYSEEVLSKVNNNIKTVDLSSGVRSESIYSIIFNDNNGLHQVLIEPNDKIIDALYHVRPNIVKKQIINK